MKIDPSCIYFYGYFVIRSSLVAGRNTRECTDIFRIAFRVGCAVNDDPIDIIKSISRAASLLPH
jgi:hypothetical protein